MTNNLEHLLRESDYVSLHVPLTDATRAMINTATLGQMKQGAYLINTSRGAVIDEAALLEAVQQKVIAGAALDVLTQEPPAAGHPLMGQPNIILTPHAAFYSAESEKELRRKAAQNIITWLATGKPEYVITRGRRAP